MLRGVNIVVPFFGVLPFSCFSGFAIFEREFVFGEYYLIY